MAMPALAYATADAMHAWWDAIMAAMQAWDTPLPVLLVMAAGITAGSVIKSITGFGSTIAHLCIWSAARAVGIPSGVCVRWPPTCMAWHMPHVTCRDVT